MIDNFQHTYWCKKQELKSFSLECSLIAVVSTQKILEAKELT